jgi:hypothetical protein
MWIHNVLYVHNPSTEGLSGAGVSAEVWAEPADGAIEMVAFPEEEEEEQKTSFKFLGSGQRRRSRSWARSFG